MPEIKLRSKKLISIKPNHSSSVALALIFMLILIISVVTLLFFMDLANSSRNYVPQNMQATSMIHDYDFIKTLGWSVSGLLFFLALGGFYIAERVVFRINLIANTADNIIQTGDLSRRIPPFGSWDDLAKLADTLNQSFAKAETLMEEVRHVSDMIAHDLRTPLTRLKNRLEALRDKSEDEQLGLEEQTEDLIAEADHLLATFGALLRIRTIESGKWRGVGEDIMLAQLIEDVLEYYEPIISEKQQELTTNLENISIFADRHLLFQAIANVIDNAVKYAPERGNISVSLEQQGENISINVKNSGSFVGDEHLDLIFHRFYRTDQARTSHQGNGLGLSLVKAIVKLHCGKINAINLDDGFAIRIILMKKCEKLLN
jgi:signal transduction histidine kinase